MRVALTVAMIVLLACGCNEAVETTEQGGSNAVGIAENMKGGTVAGTDLETGDSAEETEEVSTEDGGE